MADVLTSLRKLVASMTAKAARIAESLAAVARDFGVFGDGVDERATWKKGACLEVCVFRMRPDEVREKELLVAIEKDAPIRRHFAEVRAADGHADLLERIGREVLEQFDQMRSGVGGGALPLRG